MLVVLLAGCGQLGPDLQEGLTAEMEPVLTKAAVALSGGVWNLRWADGDSLLVNGQLFVMKQGQAESSRCLFIPVSGTMDDISSPYKAFCPPSIAKDGRVILPSVQHYLREGSVFNPMYAESTGRDLSFSNLCGILRMTLKGDAIVRNIALIDGTHSMSGPVEIVGGNRAVVATEKNAGIVLDCGSAGVKVFPEGTDFLVSLPPGEYSSLRMSVLDKEGRQFERTLTDVVTVERNTLVSVEMELGEYPSYGKSPKGAFTVGFDGDIPRRVMFAGGNVYVHLEEGNTGRQMFTFFEHQYEHKAAGYLADSYGGHFQSYFGPFSYFRWSGANFLISMPADFETTRFNECGTMIGDGKTWRTLAADEWGYVLHGAGRGPKIGNEPHSRFFKGEIQAYPDSSIAGLFLVPDSFVWPDGVDIPSGVNDPSRRYDSNRISLTVWGRLEEGGMVFLPAAGCSPSCEYFWNGASSFAGEYGMYWSSTYKSSDYSYNLFFSDNSLAAKDFSAWQRPMTVRLVKKAD